MMAEYILILKFNSRTAAPFSLHPVYLPREKSSGKSYCMYPGKTRAKQRAETEKALKQHTGNDTKSEQTTPTKTNR
jgi:hypothetical protein